MLLIDAHVHIHDCFDLATFMEAAATNFKAEAIRRRREAFTGILLLSEAATESWFRHLSDFAGSDRISIGRTGKRWSLQPTNESCSLLIHRAGEEGFFLIAGRQIITEERLEVLALATDRDFRNGMPLEETIRVIRECGSLPSIPWGFGKWMGRRGRILADYLSKKDEKEYLFLGDNGGRPGFLPRPFFFKLAEKKKIKILPGSDPLPFASEVRRVGGFGCSIEGFVSIEHPAEDLRHLLLNPLVPTTAYGGLQRPLLFVRNQLSIQIGKARFKPKSCPD